MSTNKVKYGISNVHYAKMTVANDGTISYGTPVAIPGAVSLSADPEGDTSPFYADNIVYYTSVSNNGYSGDLEVAMLPDSFLTDILGAEIDSNGAIFEANDDTVSQFALMFQMDGDKANRRVCYYNVTAQRPSTEANTTEDSKEPQTDTISITMAPRTTDKVVKCVMEKTEDNTAAYNGFFNAVYEKYLSV